MSLSSTSPTPWWNLLCQGSFVVTPCKPMTTKPLPPINTLEDGRLSIELPNACYVFAPGALKLAQRIQKKFK